MAMVMLMGVLVSNIQPSYIRAEGSAAEQTTGGEATGGEASGGETAGDKATGGEASGDETTDIKTTDTESKDALSEEGLLIRANEDITRYVNVKLKEMAFAYNINSIAKENGKEKYIIKDGELQIPVPKMGNGEGVMIKYTWSIPDKYMRQVRPGNYFTIQLPQGNVLKESDVPERPIIDKQGKQVGIFTVKNGVLTATFTEDMSGNDRLKDGTFKVFSKIDKQGGHILVPKEYAESDKIEFDIIPGGGGGSSSKPLEQEHHSNKNVAKDAWQDNYCKQYGLLGFNIWVNDKEFTNTYSSTTPTTKENVVIIDELPEGLGDFHSIEVIARVLAPKLKNGEIDPGKTSNVGLLYPRLIRKFSDGYKIEKCGAKIYERSSKDDSDWGNFKEEIKGKGKTHIAIGLWRKLDNNNKVIKSKLIAAFGNLPGNITYGNLYDNSKSQFEAAIEKGLKEEIEQWQGTTLSPETRNAMIEAAKSLYSKKVAAYNIVLRAYITDKNKTQFTNRVDMNWNGNQSEHHEINKVVSEAEGGIDYENDTVTITAEKTWVGPKKDKVILQLKDGENVLQTIELNEGNQWKGTFKPERKYRNQELINYQVVEKDVPQGYEAKVEGDAAGGHFKVTNSLKKTRVEINKLWTDSKGDETEAPVNEITVKLYRKVDGTKDAGFEQEIKILESEGWKKTVEDLDLYDASGKEYEYFIEEVKIDGYTSKTEAKNIGDPTYKSFKITNKEKPGNVDIEIDKKWVAFDGVTPFVPSDNPVVRAKLYKTPAGGSKTLVEDITLAKGNNWYYSKTGLRKYEKGRLVDYSVEELTLNGYSNIKNEKKKNNDNYKFELVNKATNNPKTKITVLKVFEDKNGYGFAEDYQKTLYVKLQLLADGKPVGQPVTVDFNTNPLNRFEYTFENLDVYNRDGSKIKYSVKEVGATKGFKPKVNPVEVATDFDRSNGKINGNRIVNVKQENLIEITVKKIWQDANGADKTTGLPLEIGLNVIGKDSTGRVVSTTEIKLNAGNHWTAKLKDMHTETNDGKAITYTVEEKTVPGYLNGKIDFNNDSKGNYSFTVTNKEIPKTEIQVEKKWQDDKGGKLPEDHKRLQAVQSITVELIKDFVPTGITKTLNKANGWKASFTGLDKTKVDGTAISYSVRETVVPDGFEAVTNPASAVNGKADIINKLLPKYTDITVNKKWVGINSGQPKVTLKLVQSINGGAFTDVAGKSIELPQGNRWDYTFRNLPLEDNLGNSIRYEVREDSIPAGYSRSYDHQHYTVINTKIDKIEITVEKQWLQKDNNNGGYKVLPPNYRLIPDEIEVELLADGSSMNPVRKITLTKSNSWQGKFTGLDKTDDQGRIIKYSVKETNKQNNFDLAAIADVDSENKAVIKNILTGDTTTVKITKVWKDKDGRAVAGDPSKQVKFKIFYNDNGREVVVNDNITLPDSNGRWEYTQTGLTKFDQEGNLIEYKVEETSVPEGYFKEVKKDNNSFTFTATNQVIPKINIEVEKQWVDENRNPLPNDYSLLPDSLEIKLLANGTAISYKGEASVRILKSANWKYTFEDLYELDENGKTIKYSIQEVLPADVKKSFINLTGTPEVNNKKATLINQKSDERVSVSVKKIWKDLNNNDITENLPEITFKLWKVVNGQDKFLQDIKLPIGGKYETVITGLPKYDEKGLRIVYKITEEVPNGYYAEPAVTVVGENSVSFEITNRTMPKIDIGVEKKWVNKDGNALPEGYNLPDSIRVKLLANGKETGKTIDLLKSNNWKGEFKGLDRKDASGKDIEYTIEEIMPEKFKETFVGSVVNPKEDNGYKAVITNKDTDQKVKVKIKKVWQDVNGSDITGTIADNVEVTVAILRYDGKVAGKDTYTPIKEAIKLSKANNWEFESDYLPKLDDKGNEIVYDVREVEVPSGYWASKAKKDNTFEFTITNRKISKTKIDVEKRWLNKDNTELAGNYQPEKITVVLLANGKEIKTLDVLKSNGWKGTFTDLDLTDSHGNAIVYEVKEKSETIPEGFVRESTNKKPNAQGTVVITNKKVDDTVKLNIRKIWLDKNNNTITNSNLLPQFVRLQLFANGVSKGTIYVYKDKGFMYESENLAKYDERGNKIEYTIKEIDNVYGYTLTSISRSSSGLEFTVTNTENPNTPPYVPYIPPAPSIPDEPVPTPPGPTPPAPNTPPEEATIEDDDVVLSDGDDEEVPDEPIDDDLPKANENLPKTHDLLNTFTNTFAVIAVSAIGLGIKEISNIRRKKDDEK